jgi:hypothetical protein
LLLLGFAAVTFVGLAKVMSPNGFVEAEAHSRGGRIQATGALRGEELADGSDLISALPEMGDEIPAPAAPITELAPLPVGGSRQFFSPAQRSALVRYGNGRAIVPLLLTSLSYHGSSLIATTIHSWIVHFLIPQRNIDVVIFYDHNAVNLSELITRLRLKKFEGGSEPATAEDFRDGGSAHLSDSDKALLLGAGGGMFTTPYHATYTIRLHPVVLPFPEYIVQNMTLLREPSWLRCGCPPVCPQKRATVDYVQGTRWYTYDLFLEPIARRYSFWIKLDVDIWFFRPPEFNLVDTMVRSGAIFAHTGYIYNGEGCSNELHKALLSYLATRNFSAVSDKHSWWVQDDNVYYSNFVITSMGFHLSEAHMQLAKFLNEYRNGFFRYRWTDQSLFHKVFGVFLGPLENTFALDWSHWRCQKRVFRPQAVFYHSKQLKKKAMLKRCTNI